MKKFLLFQAFTIALAIQLQAQWNVETVPNPHEKNNKFVSNPDNILTNNEVSNLNNLIQESEDSTKVQVAVVMLKSIGTAVPKEFATALFNKWGVGVKGMDNGLLILFVMDQRRVEFETGYGLEAILTDAKCYEIQQNYMIPRFKEGYYSQGMIDGVLKSLEITGGLSANSDSLITSSENYSSKTDNNNNPDPNYNSSYHSFLGYYIRFTVLAIFLYIILFSITLFQSDCFIKYKTLRIFTLYIWFLIFPIPFVLFYYFTKNLMETWRNTPRISPKTGRIMHKLSEKEDNQYLQAGQITEENIKSIDYDVWLSDEPGDILVISYKRWFSEYSSCPKCKFKTYFKEYDRVITSPTYSSSGTGERKHVCKNCNHSAIVRYTIPRKTQSSNSSSSSGSFGGRSSFGGSSFGGGSSGGGGAGSSW